jgi:hypothetical protein
LDYGFFQKRIQFILLESVSGKMRVGLNERASSTSMDA